MALLSTKFPSLITTPLLRTTRLTSCHNVNNRQITTTPPTSAVQSGRFRVSLKQDNPLTYEQAFKPHEIMGRKGWNSHNTSSLPDYTPDSSGRPSHITVSDAFIRKFVTGTWHSLIVSEIIIKRQHNLIRIAAIVQRSILPRKMYFLIGYTEELLGHWLQCPIKLELQTVESKQDVIFKYV